MVMGIGAFAQSSLRILRENGAQVIGYLSRDYGHYGPSLEAKCYSHQEHPDPLPLIQQHRVDVVLPMSIDWAEKRWAADLVKSGVGIFCPTGEALQLERQRDLARKLCTEYGVPFPRAYWARTRAEAERIVKRESRPFVIKNPICGPFSPIHTIVCERTEDTRAWLPRLDYKDGVFLQEYLGRAEAGHIAVVSGGELRSLVTNQEYKRAFTGNQGVVAGAPLGGLVEADPEDKYGLAKSLLKPLLPWFRQVNFHGPVQVTAIRHEKRWHVLEYNVRIGVTSGAMLLRMLEKPVDLQQRVARNELLGDIRFRPNLRFGCSITLAGYGYPFTQISGPEVPVQLDGKIDGDVWWNEVRGEKKALLATGHRIADVTALGRNLNEALEKANRNIARIQCLGSYYRTDIGASLWPPGRV